MGSEMCIRDRKKYGSTCSSSLRRKSPYNMHVSVSSQMARTYHEGERREREEKKDEKEGRNFPLKYHSKCRQCFLLHSWGFGYTYASLGCLDHVLGSSSTLQSTDTEIPLIAKNSSFQDLWNVLFLRPHILFKPSIPFRVCIRTAVLYGTVQRVCVCVRERKRELKQTAVRLFESFFPFFLPACHNSSLLDVSE